MDTALVISLAVILALLVLSAFFSGSETALTAASHARMHHLERRGSRLAGTVNRLTERREALIGAILLGNNLVNILASALVTSLLIGVFGSLGIVYATVAMTALVVVFAEILPKTYAIRRPERVALAVAPAIRVAVWLLAPATTAVQAVIAATFRLFGYWPGERRSLVSPAEEIQAAADLYTRTGGLVGHERDMIGSILDLSEVAISEVMVHRRAMFMVDADETPEAIIGQILSSPYTRVPVWRDNPENIVGVLHAKDVLAAIIKNGGATEGIEVVALAREPWFVPETTMLHEQLNAFRRRAAHFALVVDEYGALMGVVTLEDIIEEIVGDITDEHDVAAAGIHPAADGSCVVDGTVTIRDLNRQFDWDLPDEEATTIAGLTLHEAKVIPEVGQVFRVHGFRFEVLRRQRNQITALRVTPPVPTPDTPPA